MSTEEKALEVYKRLKKVYPTLTIELDYRSAWELLVATILSAQATDKLVNSVTPQLFTTYPSVRDFARADVEEVQEHIKRVNFYRNKAKYIQKSAEIIVEKHEGTVPNTMEDLTALPGVSRKTANVILGHFYGIPAGIVIDTHGIRISRKLGLTEEKRSDKIEKDLMEIVPQDKWIEFGSMITLHGRHTCTARAHDCSDCPLGDLCPEYDEWKR